MAVDDHTTNSSPTGPGSASPEPLHEPRFHPLFRIRTPNAAIFQSGSDQGEPTQLFYFSLPLLAEISPWFRDLSSGSVLDTPVPIELPLATVEGLALVLSLVRDALDLPSDPSAPREPELPRPSAASAQGWPSVAALDNIIDMCAAYELSWCARRLCHRVPISAPAHAFQRFVLAAATGQDVAVAARATVLFDLRAMDAWTKAYLAHDADAHVALYDAHLRWTQAWSAFETSFLSALPNVVGQCRWPPCFHAYKRVVGAMQREFTRDGNIMAMEEKGRMIIAAGEGNPAACPWCQPNYPVQFQHAFDTVIKPFFNGTSA